MDINWGKFARLSSHILLYPVYKFIHYLLDRKYSGKYNYQNEIDKFFNNRKSGFHIEWANHWFGYLYSCYSTPLMFLTLTFSSKYLGDGYLSTILSAIPVVIFYIPAYIAVFHNKKYLKYFRSFEKKDHIWLNKWRRITIAFIIGAVASFVTGLIISAIITAKIYYNIDLINDAYFVGFQCN